MQYTTECCQLNSDGGGSSIFLGGSCQSSEWEFSHPKVTYSLNIFPVKWVRTLLTGAHQKNTSSRNRTQIWSWLKITAQKTPIWARQQRFDFIKPSGLYMPIFTPHSTLLVAHWQPSTNAYCLYNNLSRDYLITFHLCVCESMSRSVVKRLHPQLITNVHHILLGMWLVQ